MYPIYLNVGRWQGIQDFTEVRDLSEETLREVARKHWQQTPNASRLGTQVLVWDGDRVHNLLAVYTPDCDKLTVL